jgi:hypothetical protein
LVNLITFSLYFNGREGGREGERERESRSVDRIEEIHSTTSANQNSENHTDQINKSSTSHLQKPPLASLIKEQKSIILLRSLPHSTNLLHPNKKKEARPNQQPHAPSSISTNSQQVKPLSEIVS